MTAQIESATDAPQGIANADLRRVYRTFAAFAAVGIVAALLYSLATSPRWASALAVVGGAVLIAGAFTLVGALIGFVFAIPRSRQEQGVIQVQTTTGADANRPRQRLSDYAANTNLEQISDWLTKILVGVSLIQFGELSDRFGRAATALSPLLGDHAMARPAALTLMTYFALWGFFFAYLLTRLWLPKALSRAEREEEVQKREVEKEAELRALERRTYDYLYQPPPGGYTRAIEEIEAHHARPGSPRSAWLWVYLASAYGQRHRDEKESRREEAARATRDKVVAAVEEALKMDPSTLPILEQLYRARDPSENDLATLKGDERLEKLLGEKA